MITRNDILITLKEVDSWLCRKLPVDISIERLNEIKADEISKLLNKRGYECIDDEYINAEYIGDRFPRLTYLQCEEFLEYCQKQTIKRKECFGNGKLLLEKWIKDVW